VKRRLTVAALILVGTAAAAAVAVFQHIRGEQYYRRLLADGEAALAVGNAFAAVEAFSGAVALRPAAMPAYYRRAEAYRQQRQFEKAAVDLRTAMELDPDAPQPRAAMGDLLDAQGDAAGATQWYQSAAERLQNTDPALLYRLALVLYRSGSPAAAIDPLTRALARNEAFAEAHYLLGLAYRDSHKLEAAVGALEQAIRIAPSLVAAREELADLYRVLGRAEDEAAQLQALAARDDQIERRIAVALAEARRQQYGRALELLAAEAQRSPSDSRVHLALGRVHLRMGEDRDDLTAVARALADLERALGGSARRSQGLALYGRALYLAGEEENAERILRDAITTSPVHPPAFEYLADVSERLGHFAAARDALLDLDALEGSTTAGAARARRAQRIGLLSLRAGEPAAAAVYLQQAVAAGLENVPTLAALARARLAAGDLAGARDAVQRGLRIDPRHAELLRLARTITANADRAGRAARLPRS
jgi:tetratricopeptide (TPR) repeat protein